MQAEVHDPSVAIGLGQFRTIAREAHTQGLPSASQAMANGWRRILSGSGDPSDERKIGQSTAVIAACQQQEKAGHVRNAQHSTAQHKHQDHQAERYLQQRCEDTVQHEQYGIARPERRSRFYKPVPQNSIHKKPETRSSEVVLPIHQPRSPGSDAGSSAVDSSTASPAGSAVVLAAASAPSSDSSTKPAL